MGMPRRDSQGLPAVDDILAQSECQRGNAFLCFLLTHGIVVERAQHTRHGGIVAVAMVLSDHFLQHDSHLLLVDDIGCRRHVSLGVAVIDRSIDALDSRGEHTQHLVLVVEVGNHIRRIDTGERLVVAVLKQRAGTNGDGTVRSLKEGEEVGNITVGQLRLQEVLKDDFVRRITKRNVIEIVLLHKLIEDIGAEHHGLRDLHGSTTEAVEVGMRLDDVVEKGQTTSFATKRTVADTRKVGVAVELATVEDCHDTEVFHVTILHDGIEDDLSVSIHILELMPRDMLEEVAHGKDGTGTEPATHVVARDMVKHGVARYLEDIVLQLL